MIQSFLNQSPHEYQNMRPGLARMRFLLQQMGLTPLPFQSILVAGTNGKGSVARMLELALRLQGFKVGLYTSPHLFKFNERIQVSGNEIATDAIEKILSKLLNLKIIDAGGQGRDIGEGRPTFFELATALAFQYFAEQQIDIAVLEVGLGGRLDATNVVDPLVSILVSIGHDHMEILGDTLEKVCWEKMGVFRENGINVVGELLPELESYIKKYFSKESLYFLRDEIILNSALSSQERSDAGSVSLFQQPCQQHNARLVGLVMHVMNKRRGEVSSPLIEGRGNPAPTNWNLHWLRWAESLSLPARYEKRKNFILDGAHNPEAAQALVASLKQDYPNKKFVFMIGMVKGKDHPAFLKILQPLAQKMIFCEFDHPRSMQMIDWKKLNVADDSVIVKNIEEAMSLAKKYQADLTTPIIITGSFYWVAACGLAVL